MSPGLAATDGGVGRNCIFPTCSQDEGQRAFRWRSSARSCYIQLLTTNPCPFAEFCRLVLWLTMTCISAATCWCLPIICFQVTRWQTADGRSVTFRPLPSGDWRFRRHIRVNTFLRMALYYHQCELMLSMFSLCISLSVISSGHVHIVQSTNQLHLIRLA